MPSRSAKWYEIPITGNPAAEAERLKKLDSVTRARSKRRARDVDKVKSERQLANNFFLGAWGNVPRKKDTPGFKDGF